MSIVKETDTTSLPAILRSLGDCGENGIADPTTEHRVCHFQGIKPADIIGIGIRPKTYNKTSAPKAVVASGWLLARGLKRPIRNRTT